MRGARLSALFGHTCFDQHLHQDDDDGCGDIDDEDGMMTMMTMFGHTSG